MTCLAFEFSSDRRSVAVASGDRVLAEVVHQGTLRTPVFALIGSVLEKAGIGRGEIRRLAVGTGPGSYTGIRLSIAVVQGWQLARGIPTIGGSSLEGLAAAAVTVADSVLLAVDAQRGEFATAVAENGKLVEPVRLLTLTAIRQRQNEGWRIAGPEIGRLLPGAMELFPSAANLAQRAVSLVEVPAESLAPVYLREASFVKAPPPRKILPD